MLTKETVLHFTQITDNGVANFKMTAGDYINNAGYKTRGSVRKQLSASLAKDSKKYNSTFTWRKAA